MLQNRIQRRVCPRFISIGDSDVFSVRDLDVLDPESDTVTCILPDIYSSRTQWHVFRPRFWIYMLQNRIQWRCVCPRFISIGHSDVFSVRDFGLTRPRIGHNDGVSVRDLFQSDTVTCFLSKILDLRDPESETVTCILSEIYFSRTQWHVFRPRFWIYMTQNLTQWLCVCPRIIPIINSDMFSVRDFGLTWPRIGHSDVYSVRDLFQSDTVTCFLYEILDLHDLESDTVTCYMSENLEIRILSPLSTAS
jgi:hypothetical protein